jgi:hypothetical protein
MDNAMAVKFNLFYPWLQLPTFYPHRTPHTAHTYLHTYNTFTFPHCRLLLPRAALTTVATVYITLFARCLLLRAPRLRALSCLPQRFLYTAPLCTH